MRTIWNAFAFVAVVNLLALVLAALLPAPARAPGGCASWCQEYMLSSQCGTGACRGCRFCSADAPRCPMLFPAKSMVTSLVVFEIARATAKAPSSPSASYARCKCSRLVRVEVTSRQSSSSCG